MSKCTTETLFNGNCSGGFAPTVLRTYPTGFVWARFRRQNRQNRGGIGGTDCMPPPPIGASPIAYAMGPGLSNYISCTLRSLCSNMVPVLLIRLAHDFWSFSWTSRPCYCFRCFFLSLFRHEPNITEHHRIAMIL